MAEDTSGNAKVDSTRPVAEKPCGVCGKLSVPRFRPFCSARCADVDLHRWLSGNYAIPAARQDDDED